MTSESEAATAAIATVFDQFYVTLDGESDRGCVLVGAAYLDDALEALLRSCFDDDPTVVKGAVNELLGRMKPLNSFSAKIYVAYALGLINQTTHRDLHNVRSIRNRFAHRHQPMTFDEQSVTDKVKNLECPIEIPDIDGSSHSETRTRFQICVAGLCGFLDGAVRNPALRAPPRAIRDVSTGLLQSAISRPVLAHFLTRNKDLRR